MAQYPYRRRRKSLKDFISNKKVRIKKVLRVYDGDTIRVELLDGLSSECAFFVSRYTGIASSSKEKPAFCSCSASIYQASFDS